MPPEKRCTACGQTKPADSRHWHRNGATRDGWHTRCKQCRREQCRQGNQDYYRRHGDRCRAYSRRHYYDVVKPRAAGVSV